MIKLPVAFLPFDPATDYDDSDDDDDDSSSDIDDADDESNETPPHGSMTNGNGNHDHKSARHTGGGVVLVRVGSWNAEISINGSLGFGQRMCFGGDVSCSNKENYEPSSNTSIDGRWTDSGSIGLLHIETGKQVSWHIRISIVSVTVSGSFMRGESRSHRYGSCS